ncbi:MAG TPA: TolC family protein [Terriglobales bacterium]|nr:TolC family protein [Terriglobales bacterium]
MKPSSRGLSRALLAALGMFFAASITPRICSAEPLPLRRAVQLALTHSTTSALADADVQRALSGYKELRNQYIPQFVIGSGLGATWGYPLSLEGSAPSIVNLTSQSALINPALREFLKAAQAESTASNFQAKDQRSQVIQDAVLTYTELSKWEPLLDRLRQNQANAAKMEERIQDRVREGVDSALDQNKARLATARARLRVAQAEGAIDVLRRHLSDLTGVPAANIETEADSIPAFPEIQQADDLSAKAVQNSAAVQAADGRAMAQSFRARGEHRALWPTIDFAAQYALLASFNNYENFFRAGSFQQHNATVGIAMRFPFLSWSQRARADGADVTAIRARKEADALRNQVSEETLRLQRSVEQLAAAQQVADLESQLAQSNLDAVQVRFDSGGATLHDLADAQTQADERYNALQAANLELQRARIQLLRATGDLESWVGISK